MKKAIINGKLVFPDRIEEGNLILDGKHILAAGMAEVPECAEVIDAKGLFVGPGLIDQHVHGYSSDTEGYDILHDVKSVAMAHLKHGVTSVVPSPSYSLNMESFLQIIVQCRELIKAGDTPVIGIHLEGPYINHRMGAGRKYAWKYSDYALRKLFEAGGEDILHCTYAPEMPWAQSVEDIIREYGIVMDIGHTEAGPEDIYRAVSKGARIVTHLFDATGNAAGIHAADRTGDYLDGVSMVTLGIPGMYYEIISDSCSLHASIPAQRLAFRCGGDTHVILVSDCTFHRRAFENNFPENVAGTSAASYKDVNLPETETTPAARDVNLDQRGRLFGSRLNVADAAVNFRRATGCDIRQLFRCASTNSAEALKISDRVGSILPGRDANIIFVDENFAVKRIIFQGEEVNRG